MRHGLAPDSHDDRFALVNLPVRNRMRLNLSCIVQHLSNRAFNFNLYALKERTLFTSASTTVFALSDTGNILPSSSSFSLIPICSNKATMSWLLNAARALCRNRPFPGMFDKLVQLLDVGNIAATSA